VVDESAESGRHRLTSLPIESNPPTEGEANMKTIQGTLAGIRGLQQEELDLVGGAFSTETSFVLTSTTMTVGDHSILAMDDCHTFSYSD
jgi:hypothetical protein